MMRTVLKLMGVVFFLSSVMFVGLASAADTAAEIGKTAPAFSLPDTSGNLRALEEFRDKTVILEWTNHDCPYVRKHYGTGNMQALQKDMTDADVIWLTIISSVPGKQGYVTPAEADELTASRGAHPTAVLLDVDGTVGRLYGAKTTPQMYIITPDRDLVYAGAIDDKPTARRASIEGAHNYVRAAYASLEAGEAIESPSTKPYGCSVKY